MDTKTLARRFLEESADDDRESVYAHHCTADYTEHDPNMEQETVGLAEATRLYREVREAFEVTHTAQSLVAEGDLVCARFVIHGRHAGDYRGTRPAAEPSRRPTTSRCGSSRAGSPRAGSTTIWPARSNRSVLLRPPAHEE